MASDLRLLVLVAASLAAALAALLPSADAFHVTPMKRSSFVSPPHHRCASHVPSSASASASALTSSAGARRAAALIRMAADAEAEAEELKEKARKLREEVAELTGAEEEEEEEAEGEGAEAAARTNPPDGTVYDDEVEEYRDPLSDNMRARLLAEASTGLDADAKQTNVILYICIGVAVLVALGGSGILY